MWPLSPCGWKLRRFWGLIHSSFMHFPHSPLEKVVLFYSSNNLYFLLLPSHNGLYSFLKKHSPFILLHFYQILRNITATILQTKIRNKWLKCKSMKIWALLQKLFYFQTRKTDWLNKQIMSPMLCRWHYDFVGTVCLYNQSIFLICTNSP